MTFCILNEKCCVLIQISVKFIPKVPINNNFVLIQIMAWCWTGGMPLSEPMMAKLTGAPLMLLMCTYDMVICFNMICFALYDACKTSHSWVNMMVADGLASVWCQDISNHYDGTDWSSHISWPIADWVNGFVESIPVLILSYLIFISGDFL